MCDVSDDKDELFDDCIGNNVLDITVEDGDV